MISCTPQIAWALLFGQLGFPWLEMIRYSTYLTKVRQSFIKFRWRSHTMRWGYRLAHHRVTLTWPHSGQVRTRWVHYTDVAGQYQGQTGPGRPCGCRGRRLRGYFILSIVLFSFMEWSPACRFGQSYQLLGTTKDCLKVFPIFAVITLKNSLLCSTNHWVHTSRNTSLPCPLGSWSGSPQLLMSGD